MSNLKISIKNIKSIQNFSCEFPLESGIYAIVGLNGSGKSTILAALSLLLRRTYPPVFPYCATSEIVFNYESQENKLKQKGNIWWNLDERQFAFNGMYEGSLFYGTRFNDSTIIDSLLANGKLASENIVSAYDYVKEKLSYILHGEPNHYNELYKIINRNVAKTMRLKNVPYFYKYNDVFISQYKMSSGECLLISLLHYIHNALINKSVPEDQKVLILIDEIELALHPAAVSRLFSLFENLLYQHTNLVIYLTSHSPEVIKELPPQNIFLLDRDYSSSNSQIHLISPCYPNYAIRSLHEPCGYDNIVLVEDRLAKKIVEKIIIQNKICNSRLIKVIPVGGWKNVLQLQESLINAKVFGTHTCIGSILDGDAKREAGKLFPNCPKRFLPIPSLEKFLFKNLLVKPNYDFKKTINDKYFTISNLDSIIANFKNKHEIFDEGANKPFYDFLINNLPRDISEDSFILNICDDILTYIEVDKFADDIKGLLSAAVTES